MSFISTTGNSETRHRCRYSYLAPNDAFIVFIFINIKHIQRHKLTDPLAAIYFILYFASPGIPPLRFHRTTADFI
jgi:hypothetical protein